MSTVNFVQNQCKIIDRREQLYRNSEEKENKNKMCSGSWDSDERWRREEREERFSDPRWNTPNKRRREQDEASEEEEVTETFQ